MRLIDADALIEKLGIAKKCNDCEYNEEPYCRWKPDVVDICEAINDAPTIEPERKTGKWINNLHDIPICNQCGYMTPYDRAIDDYEYGNYCPNCGAKLLT